MCNNRQPLVTDHLESISPETPLELISSTERESTSSTSNEIVLKRSGEEHHLARVTHANRAVSRAKVPVRSAQQITVSTDPIPSISGRTVFNRNVMQSSTIASSSGTRQLINQESTNAAFNQEHQSLSSPVPVEHVFRPDHRTVARSLPSPLLSQPIPDSIINDKQATNRISNERNSTPSPHLSKRAMFTPISLPIDSSSPKTSKWRNDDQARAGNHRLSYQVGSLFTSTSTFLMHQNEVIAHATASDPFLSDTIFIIIIATLTIIILLFCLGLFCLCRRTTKRNLSPSFDGGTYTGLYGQSFAMPADDYQAETSKYENDLSSPSSMHHPSLLNDRMLLPQTVALHHTAKQRAQLSKSKLKKKRAGFCCCNSTRTPSIGVNGQTRTRRNQT